VEDSGMIVVVSGSGSGKWDRYSSLTSESGNGNGTNISLTE
jgi:hypothetical protein